MTAHTVILIFIPTGTTTIKMFFFLVTGMFKDLPYAVIVYLKSKL